MLYGINAGKTKGLQERYGAVYLPSEEKTARLGHGDHRCAVSTGVSRAKMTLHGICRLGILTGLDPLFALIGTHCVQRMIGIAEHEKFQRLVPCRVVDHLAVILCLTQEFFHIRLKTYDLVQSGKPHTHLHNIVGCTVAKGGGAVCGKLAAAHPIGKGYLNGENRKLAQAKKARCPVENDPSHGAVQVVMAGDMPALVGNDRWDQLLRHMLQKSGGQHNKGLCISCRIGIWVYVQLQIHLRHFNAQLFTDGQQHMVVLWQLLFTDAEICGHILDTKLFFVPDLHKCFEKGGKSRDRLQGVQGSTVGFVHEQIVVQHIFSPFRLFTVSAR